MRPLRPGTRGTIVAGPFKRVSSGRAKVVEHRSDELIVELEIAGRAHRVAVMKSEFRRERRAKDPTPFIWAEIQWAVRRSVGYWTRRDAWWAARLDLAKSQEELLALWTEFAEIEHALEAEVAEACAKIEPAFRQRFDPLSPAEKRKLWRSEREQWLEAPPPLAVEELVKGKHARDRAENAARAERCRLHPLGEPDPRTAPIATAEEIEAAIDRDPDAADPYLVYADVLQSAGDPRGELIMLQSSSERERPDLQSAEAELLKRHGSYFLGALADHPESVRLEWSRGFIRAATLVGECGPEIMETLLSLPSARYLRSITLEHADIADDYERTLEVLIGHRPHHLASICIGTEDEPEVGWSRDFDAGDLTELLRAVPQIEELRVRAASVSIREIDLPRLRSLRVETSALSHDNLSLLSSRRWPSLEELNLTYAGRRSKWRSTCASAIWRIWLRISPGSWPGR